MTQGTIYLLCFPEGIESRPGVRARHYLGWASDPDKRVGEHLRGVGSPLVKAAIERGMTPVLVATWEGDRHRERQMKRSKNLPRFCPHCNRHSRQSDISAATP